MADQQVKINDYIRRVFNKLESLKTPNKVIGSLEGSPASPATYNDSEPVNHQLVLTVSNYGKEILQADDYEAFSELMTEIASHEGLDVNNDLDEIAKAANLIRFRFRKQPI